jgi:redox-regulated HSP33 family molecular chaperone|tara:strand:+ start:394 stop:672 length:279 start_codon:yes stop_codon:yes gene_type:complete
MKKTTFKAVMDRDIETVLWDLVEDSLREFNISRNCKIGRQTFSNILSTLSQMEMLKRRREDKNMDAQLEQEEYDMKDWLTVLDGGEVKVLKK